MDMTQQETNYHQMEDWRGDLLVRGFDYVKINGHWVIDDVQEIREAIEELCVKLHIEY